MSPNKMYMSVLRTMANGTYIYRIARFLSPPFQELTPLIDRIPPRRTRVFDRKYVGPFLLLFWVIIGSSCGQNETLPPLPVKQVQIDLLETFLANKPESAAKPWSAGPVEVKRQNDKRTADVGELFVNIKKMVVKKGGNRPCLLMSPPCTVAFTTEIPPDGKLEFGAGLGQSTLEQVKSAVTFRVDIEGKEVFSHTFQPLKKDGPKPDWEDAVIDVGEFAGSPVSITFEVDTAEPTGDGPLIAGWSQPSITTIRNVDRVASSPEKPNVIFIVVDTLRADHLGCYGYPRPTSPTIDRLAKEGVLFEKAISQSSWTWPATATLLTGLYPYTHGVTKAEQCYLAQRLPCAGEIFQGEGFRTKGVSANPLICEAQNFDQGFEELVEIFHEPAEVVNEHAIPYLRAQGDERFFLYLHYMDPHYPYAPPEEDLRHFREGRDGEKDNKIYKAIAEAKNQVVLQKFAGEVQYLTDLYDGEIRHFDNHLEKLLNVLTETGLSEKTILVITSDHGEELFEHGRVGHARTLYTEVIHVPLILHAPFLFPAKRIDGLVETIDVLPTLLQLAAVKQNASAMQGRVLPIGDESVSRRKYAFSTTAMGHPNGLGLYMNQNTIQSEDWKLFYRPATGKSFLYNKKSDEAEQHPISGEAKVVESLWKEVTNWMRDTHKEHAHRAVSRNVQDNLNELGYVDVPDPDLIGGTDPPKAISNDESWDGKTFVHPLTKEKKEGPSDFREGN